MLRAIVEKTFNYKGFECRVLFMKAGHRCGYVKIPATHSMCDSSYEEYNEAITCHGGITYLNTYLINEDCPDGSKWIGFDCNHITDDKDIESMKTYFPGTELEFDPRIRDIRASVKTLEFCINQCERIVDQIAEMPGELLND